MPYSILEAIHELSKINEKWDEPVIDLNDVSQYPCISHFTDSVKKLFCILEVGKLKPSDTNKESAICFSYFPYIEYERDPDKFKYGIIFNTKSFKEKLEAANLSLNYYHATATKLNSRKKETRIKYIGQKNSKYYLKLTGYDFSTPINMSAALYNKIKKTPAVFRVKVSKL